jgi:hypothetical protein
MLMEGDDKSRAVIDTAKGDCFLNELFCSLLHITVSLRTEEFSAYKIYTRL